MTREDSLDDEAAMDTTNRINFTAPNGLSHPTTNGINHTAPLATLPTTPLGDEEDISFEKTGEKKRGGTFPRMAHFNVPEDTPPNSQNGTLKAAEARRPQRQNGSLKGPWNRKNRGKGVPVVEADTAKVLEMYLKRRSKSLNDAVLTREYLSQEKKRKVRALRNNTISICSTISTDSTTSEVHYQAHGALETTSSRDEKSTDVVVDKTVFTRNKVAQQSFHEAMKCSIMEESSTMEQSADDELSSSDEMSPRSRSAPSTLRMQIRRDTKESFDTLKLRDNGSATLTRDGFKHDSKKEPRRKRSFLDKAKQIIRSPSTSRKIVRTPSTNQRYEEREREKEKERLKEAKELEKEQEKERQKKEKQEKEQLEERLKDLEKERKKREKERKEREKERKEREKEKLKEMEKRMKELKERRERDEMARTHTRHYARTEVHSEMKKTGFTARLKETFRRSSRDKHRHREHPKHDDPPAQSDVRPKRWPSFQFRRKSRKSASTPTDESGAGATTPSDTASMDFEYYAVQPDHTRSLNDAERRRLMLEMRRGARREMSSGTASDSQILDRGEQTGGHPLLCQARSHDSVGSFASSEGSERLERPRTLAFRRTRAERAQRGLNNVIRLDTTTPGHMRRDVDTAAPLLPAPLALVADDLVRDGGGHSHPRPSSGAEAAPPESDDRNITDSWTESGDGSDIPFEQRNQAEREEYFKRIADRLAMIGDQALADYEFQEQGGAGAAPPGGAHGGRAVQSTCTTEVYSSCATAATGAVGGATGDHAMDYINIGTRIRTDVDNITVRRRSLALFPAPMVMGVVLNDTYQSFCSTMQDIVGQDVGWEQLAIVFKFTKVAVKAAHSMGKHASSIKDNSVRFIGDRFAGWLDSQGGWGSVVTSDDSDSLHEESEID